ncbi:MAG: hypothetical protein ACI9DJ_002242 [Algoriphagus sp.]
MRALHGDKKTIERIKMTILEITLITDLQTSMTLKLGYQTESLEDLTLLHKTDFNMSNNDKWPKWKEGSDLKAIREMSINKLF